MSWIKKAANKWGIIQVPEYYAPVAQVTIEETFYVVNLNNPAQRDLVLGMSSYGDGVYVADTDPRYFTVNYVYPLQGTEQELPEFRSLEEARAFVGERP